MFIKVSRWAAMGLALILIASAAYFSLAKRMILTQSRRYAASEVHGFDLLTYRYRDILVWRSVIIGPQSSLAEYTFPAEVLEQVHRVEWCGDGAGVLVEALAQHDYGESRPIQFFYDFNRRQFLTTADFKTTGAAVADAAGRCGSD